MHSKTMDSNYFLQVWGFKTQSDADMGEAGLSLLAEAEAPVVGDSIISIDIRPTEGP